MPAVVFGSEHFIYLGIFIILTVTGLACAKKYAVSPRSQSMVLKSLAIALFATILLNRLSQVFRYDMVRWEQLIPDSFCGMSSLVLSMAVLFGKKNNPVLHFVWFLALIGGLITLGYPSFLDQGPTIFYLPTISGLLHHSFAIIVVVTVLMFGQIQITWRKWYYSLFGFTCYLTVGAFLMSVFEVSDAFHIVEPMLPDTPLTVWVVAPIYAVGYGSVLWIIELVRKKKAHQ
jgi:hypothetical protein